MQLASSSITSADGAKFTQSSLEGFYDMQLGTACTPQLASDSMLRCLPVGGANASGYFSDAACTLPLAYGSTCAAVALPKWATIGVTPATCDGAVTVRVLQVTGAFSGSTAYTKSGTSCVPVMPTGVALLTLSPDVDPSMFEPMMQTTQLMTVE